MTDSSRAKTLRLDRADESYNSLPVVPFLFMHIWSSMLLRDGSPNERDRSVAQLRNVIEDAILP